MPTIHIGMQRRTHCATAGLIALMAMTMAMPAAAEPQRVSGKIVDEHGQPVANAQLANFWTWSNGQAEPYMELKVDAEGRFDGKLEFYDRTTAIVAYADNFRLAGLAVVQPDASEDVVVQLGESVPVEVRVDCPDLGGDAGWVNSYWMLGDTRPIMATAEDGRVQIRLPRAEGWKCWIYGQNVKSVTKEIALNGKQNSIDFGTIDLAATYIAKHVGRVVDEWNVTDARGVPVDAAQIKDFKGKWVLVEFWGFW